MKQFITFFEVKSSLRESLFTGFFLKTLSIILLFVVLIGYTSAQPTLTFQRCYGGTGQETAKKMIDCSGNGFVVFGETNSNDGDVSGNHGGKDIWIFRNDSTGAIVWQKCLGGSGNESFVNYHVISGGGYIITGTTTSNDGDIVGGHGDMDYWVVMIDSVGNIVWQHSLGGSGIESLFQSDYDSISGNVYLHGESDSNDGDISNPVGATDIWTVTINSLGSIINENSTGGVSDDYLEDVLLQGTNAIYVYWDDGMHLHIGAGYVFNEMPYGSWKQTTDGGGIVSYISALGGIGPEERYYVEKFSNFGASELIIDEETICEAPFGANTLSTQTGFFVSYGYNASFPCPGNIFYQYYGQYNNNGNPVVGCETHIEWGAGWNDTLSYCPNPPSPECNGFIGNTALEGGRVHFENGIYIEKSDSTCAVEWTKYLGGSGSNFFAHYIQKQANIYWILGYTSSNNGDVSGNHGSSDIWLTQLKYYGNPTLSSSTPSICPVGAATIILSPPVGSANYTWQQSTNGGASWYSVSASNPTTTTIVATINATRLFRVVYTNLCCIDTTPVFTLTVIPDPTVSLSASDNNFCAGTSGTTLTATLNGGVGTGIYQWQQYNGTSWNNISGATNATYTTPILSAITNYKVISSQTGLGCVTTGPNTINIIVKPLPNIYTIPNSATLLNGNSISLQAYNGTSYSWSPATGLNTTIGSTVIANPNTTTTYAVTGLGTNGCSKTVDIPVLVNYSTGSMEEFIQSMELYPNPANTRLGILLNTTSDQMIGFTIYDLLGKTLSQWQGKAEKGIYEQEVLIENLSQGVYFLSVRIGERVMTEKFVKE